MSKKPLSDMTAQTFVEWIGAMGGVYGTAAQKLGKSHTMVSLYANGHRRIPQDVVDKMEALLIERRAELVLTGFKLKEVNVPDMIAASNQLRQSRPGRMPSMCRRTEPEDGRVYPAYRMQYQRFAVFAEALSLWQAACVTRRQQASDIRDIALLDRELADLKVLAGNVQGLLSRGAPYDMHITFSEWFVVSRILRHETNDAKYSLYQHWRHHKGSGFPRRRTTNAQTQP